MATITAAQAGNWSATSTWTGGVVPGNGDTACLNGFVVVMNIATIPASGTLAQLDGSNGSGGSTVGRLTIDLATLGNAVINATQILAYNPGSSGFLGVSGAAPSNTLTINGNVTGGSGSNAFGIYNTSTGSVTVTGNVTGGSGTSANAIYNTSTGSVTVTGNVTAGSVSNAFGLRNNSTGTVTITGNVTGGSGSATYGIYNTSTGSVTVTGNVTGGSGTIAYGIYNVSTGLATVNSGNLINTTQCSALAGGFVYNPGPANYVEWPAAGSTTIKYPQQLAATDVRTGVVHGNLTGSLIQAGAASGSATLAKETGANARGGSGACAKLTALSAAAYGYWDFYIPVTASTPFTVSFYHKIASGFNGLLKVTIYDTDDATPLLSSQSVTLTDDSAYHQHTCTQETPTATGYCRVRLEIEKGAAAPTDIYIDDLAIA